MFRKIATVLTALVVLASLFACAQVYRNSGAQALAPKASDTLRLATYNVHYIILQRATGSWSIADWDRRKEQLLQAFRTINADAIVVAKRIIGCHLHAEFQLNFAF